MIAAYAIAGFGSFGAALACTWVLSKNALRLGLVDVPNPRSSHQSITPRGGGIGIVAGVGVGTVLLSTFGLPLSAQVKSLLLGAAAVAVLGAIDDFHPLSARYRLLIQTVVAIAVVLAIGGVHRVPFPAPLDLSVDWFAAPLAVVWLVAVTNFYNFMDGIDGLAAGQAVASCIGVGVGAWSLGASELAFAVAASSLGFLVLNKPPARIFLGDTGSTSLGFLIAGLALLAPTAHRSLALLAVAVGLSLFVLDPLETLIRLARSGHRIGTAHRQHSYQLLALTRDEHGRVAVMLVAAGVLLAALGAIAYRNPILGWPVVAIAAIAYMVERYLAARPRRPPVAGAST